MAASIKPGPKAGTRTCPICRGAGTVPVNPDDRRDGDQRCGRCGGNGEVPR